MLIECAIGELLGTAMLLAAVVGSGIMAERLSGGNEAIALLANSSATGGALVAILLTVGPVSGAHLNPLVSISQAAQGDLPWRDLPVYCLVQCIGAILGVLAANAMFDLPLIEMSTKIRSGLPLLKLYLYGYLNRIQSSRRLEREAQRNLELIWLIRRLAPDFKTIADFRKDNGTAIRSVGREFILLCRRGVCFLKPSWRLMAASSKPSITATKTSPTTNSRRALRRSRRALLAT